MRITDGTSDVCPSDLRGAAVIVRDRGATDELRRARLLPISDAQPRLPAWPLPVQRAAAAGPACLLSAGLDQHRGVQLRHLGEEIGRASCREGVCRYV